MTDDHRSAPREYDDAVQQEYDKIVAAAGEDGIKRPDALDKLTPIIEEGVKSGDIKWPDIGASVRRSVERLDEGRRSASSFRKLRDAMLGETLWAPDEDPLMQQSWPIGNGLRKAGKYLSIQDGDDMMSTKRSNMIAVAKAYDDEAAAWDDVKRAMRATGATIVGDYK